MKKAASVIALLIFAALAFKEMNNGNTFSLDISLKGAPSGTKIYLQPLGNSQVGIVDSAVFENETAVIPGNISFPDTYTIRLKLNGNLYCSFILEPGVIHFKGDFDKIHAADIAGSKETAILKQYRNDIKLALLGSSTSSGNVPLLGKLEFDIQFIRKHSNSFQAIKLLSQVLELHSLDPSIKERIKDSIPILFSILNKSHANVPLFKRLKNQYEGITKIDIGSLAPIFSQVKQNGEEVKFTDFKGKYLLIDFWASWCVPCRKEHPLFKELYNKYKDKGFEIISVSIDEKRFRDEWVKANSIDSINWTSVSDLKGTENEAAVLYGVGSTVPKNFLVNPEGIIIHKDIRGEILRNTLQNIFKY